MNNENGYFSQGHKVIDVYAHVCVCTCTHKCVCVLRFQNDLQNMTLKRYTEIIKNFTSNTNPSIFELQ